MASNSRIKKLPPRSVKTGYAQVASADPALIDASDRELVNGVHLKAPSTNTETIFVSEDKHMTLGTNTSKSGYALEPGEEIDFPVDNINKLWVATPSGLQTLIYFYS